MAIRALSGWLTFALIAAAMQPAFAQPAQSSVTFTSKQTAWLARHEKVRLAVSRADWPPFDIVSPAGEHTGITADYLKLLQARTGLTIEPVLFDDWDQVLHAALAGKVDLMGSMGKTPERERFLIFTKPYVSNPSVIIARKDQQNIADIASLRSRTVAVEAGYFVQDTLRRRYPDVKLLEVRSTADALEAVALARADAYIGNLIVSTYLIDKNYMTNLEVRAPVDFAGGDIHFAVRKQLPELRGILDAALSSLNEGDRRAIRQRWVPVADKLQSEAHGVELTAAERAWIAKHPRIRVGVDPAWEPLDFIDKDGRHSGLASAYLKLMRERIGLNLEVVPGANWTETLERAQRRELDMLALITPAPGREKDFLFTRPYVAIPIILVTRNDANFVADPSAIEGKTVAVLKDYFAGRYLADKYPKIVQLEVATMDEQLEAVNRGDAFATVGSVATLGPKIQKQYLGKLKIAGSLDKLQEMRMGVRTDWPELAVLLDKGLASISEEEHQALRQKWLAFRVEYGLDWRGVAKIALPIAAAMLIVLAVILVANRRLKRQVAETERKDATLKVQLAFQQTLMDTIPNPILFKDADARVYGCNRAYEEAFGVARADLLGCSALELDSFSPALRQKLYDDDMELLKSRGSVHEEVRVPFADGRERVVSYWKTVFNLPDGSVGGILSVVFDITEIRRLEEAAREARDAADAANRAKSSFLATMSHEIRTPMNAVMGMLELLGLTRLDDDQTRSLDIVRESAKSLLRIIDDILDFSKIEAGKLEIKPEATSVGAVLDSVFMVYSGVASSKNLLLRKYLDADISPALHADPLRLRQILNNFMSNALKFTERGEVEIRVRVVERREGLEYLEFSVRDTGIGISAENQAHLFQPFMQAEADTTRRFGGTGLGLTICRRLAQIMGGEITMQSELGKGTTMKFTAGFAPADPADLQKAAQASEAGMHRALVHRPRAPAVEDAVAKGMLVLLADDHPTNRLLLVRQLNTLGYAAEAAENGAIALQKWKTGRYALLITDCHMPEMDGYDLTRAIRAIEDASGARRIPIIACTANALQGEAEICFAAGMDDYIPKPVEMRELLSRLDRWLPLSESDTRDDPMEAAPAAHRGDDPIEPGPLAEISAGDKAVEREILQDYRKSNDADAQLMDDGFSQRDAEAVTRVAHRMKGAGRMVGARGLADLCERVEQAGREKRWSELLELKPRFDEEMRRLSRFLDML